MPDQDVLWEASSADEWSRTYNSIYKSSDPNMPKNPPSLKHVFRRFMSRDPRIQSLDFSPTQLRVFLQPLQAMVCHLHDCLDHFVDGGSDRQSSRFITQLEEVQTILQDWYTMCSRSSAVGEPGKFDPATCANLVTYHLISLNTMTSFREMELQARGGLPREEYLRSYWRIRCVEEAARIRFHCGQVIRLVRIMPEARKPPWWPAAVYRVAIIMWATSTANLLNDAGGRPSVAASRGSGRADNDTFVIDRLTPEHPSVLRYLRYREGTPALSKHGGGFVYLDEPQEPLRYCLELLSEQPATTRLAEGIKWTLSTFITREAEARWAVH